MATEQQAAFGDELRHARRNAGLTQEELAERAGVSTRAISDLERGVHQAPHRDTLEMLADALGLSPRERREWNRSGKRREAHVRRDFSNRIVNMQGAGQSLPAPDSRLAPSLHLPVPLTPLVGRDIEMRQILDLLAESRLLTLTGPGGIGKTRLALATLDEVRPCFPGGVFGVALASVRDPTLVGMTITDALGLKFSGKLSPLEILTSHIAGKKTLLVLDNFEQVIDAALLISDLLEACDSLSVLVTSRRPLNIEGEQEYSVPPLTLPGVDQASSSESLLQSDAVALFDRRARQHKPDFQLTSANAESIANICRRLDGIPLAVELAAARIKLLSPQMLLSRLEQRLPLLTGGSSNLLPRQQTMRDTIAWSYNLLDSVDQRVIQQLSVCVGGWTLEAAEAICCGNLTMLDSLQRLIDHSLVRRVDQSGRQTRFDMLETLREFMLEQLQTSGTFEEIGIRHATYFLSFAEDGDHDLIWRPDGAASDVWLDRFVLEHDNLRAALSWAESSRNYELGLRLVGAMWTFWIHQTHLTEGRAWTERFLPHDQGTNIHALMKSRLGSGMAATWQGDGKQGRSSLEEGLQLASSLGAVDSIVIAYMSLGINAMERSPPDLDLSVRYTTQALRLARDVALERSVVATLNNLALAACRQGDNRTATTLWEEALQVAQQTDDSLYLAGLHLGLATVARERGELMEAERHFREGFNPENFGRCSLGVIDLIDGFGHTLIAQQEFADGVRLIAAAGVAWQRIGMVLPDSEKSAISSLLKDAEDHMDANAYAAAWSEGTLMSLEDAIAYGRALTRMTTFAPTRAGGVT